MELESLFFIFFTKKEDKNDENVTAIITENNFVYLCIFIKYMIKIHLNIFVVNIYH